MMHSVTDLQTKRWRRYGKDRVYVSTADGRQVGWLDLLDGARHLELPEQADPSRLRCSRSLRACGGAVPGAARSAGPC